MTCSGNCLYWFDFDSHATLYAPLQYVELVGHAQKSRCTHAINQLKSKLQIACGVVCASDFVYLRSHKLLLISPDALSRVMFIVQLFV